MAYLSRKMIDVERNYKIYYSELFAIVESLHHWRHYLKQPYHTVEVLTYHSNLLAFMSRKKLKQRQM